MARLRHATAPAHARLESRLDIFNSIATPQGRRLLIERFYSLHRSADAALSPWLGALPGLDYPARRREALFVSDLTDLGLGEGAQARPCPFPPVPNAFAALGHFYVLEGSTLGGRIIRREVARAGGDMRGLSFLDPYGENAGEMWKRFVLVLEQQNPPCSAREADDIVGGARAGFQLAEEWLCATGDVR